MLFTFCLLSGTNKSSIITSCHFTPLWWWWQLWGCEFLFSVCVAVFLCLSVGVCARFCVSECVCVVVHSHACVLVSHLCRRWGRCRRPGSPGSRWRPPGCRPGLRPPQPHPEAGYRSSTDGSRSWWTLHGTQDTKVVMCSYAVFQVQVGFAFSEMDISFFAHSCLLIQVQVKCKTRQVYIKLA